jgi:excisionase family DNA binding protein
MDAARRAFYSPKEFRDLLGIGRSTLYRLLESGDVRSIRLGPRLLKIPAGELERLAASVVKVVEGSAS